MLADRHAGAPQRSLRVHFVRRHRTKCDVYATLTTRAQRLSRPKPAQSRDGPAVCDHAPARAGNRCRNAVATAVRAGAPRSEQIGAAFALQRDLDAPRVRGQTGHRQEGRVTRSEHHAQRATRVERRARPRHAQPHRRLVSPAGAKPQRAGHAAAHASSDPRRYIGGEKKDGSSIAERSTRRIYVFEFDKKKKLKVPKEASKTTDASLPKVTEPAKTSERGITLPYIGNDEPAVNAVSAKEASGAVAGMPYTVVKDDTLQKIAKKVYGSYGKWTKIYDANKDKIKNPNFVKPGTVIMIPSIN